MGADKFRVRIRTGMVPCPGPTEDVPMMDNNKARTFIFQGCHNGPVTGPLQARWAFRHLAAIFSS